MGNEHSKGKEHTKNGKLSVKHRNRSVNGASATITGLETDVQKNGGPLSLDFAIESLENDYVVIESVCPPAEAPVVSPEDSVISAEVPVISAEVPVISEIAETHKEEFKESKEEKGKLFGKLFKKKAEPPAVVESVQEKESAEENKESAEEKEASNEDQTDLSVPAPDPQPELGSSGDGAATVIVTEDREDSEYLHQKAETSTQTDETTKADISTQTSDVDDDTAANTEDPVEEDSLNESVVVITEEAFEETANEEPSDNQTAGISTEEVISAYENMVFRVEPVEVTDNFEVAHIKSSPAEETVNETEAEIAAEPGSHSNKVIVEAEVIAEESNVEEMVPLEISSSLPKVVADCVQAVFAADCESTDFAAVNTTDPSADEAITEDNGEGTRDVSAAAVLIETAEPESNAVTPEAREANGVPSLDEEPATTVTETVSEVVCEETNPSPANQDVPVDELSVPDVTEILVKVESAKEEVSIDDVVAVEDAPGTSEEIISAEAPSSEPNTTEELLKDALSSPADEVKPESVPKTITTDETNTEVGEDDGMMIADVEQETAKEADSSPVKDIVEVIPEAAIHALSLELSAIPPQEPAVDNVIPLEEEVIAPTTFVPLFGKREAGLTIPEEPSCESIAIAEETVEEAIDALSNELDDVQQSVEEVTAVKGVSGDVLAHAESSETPEQVPAISEQLVEESPSAEDATAEGDILEAVIESISEKLEANENIAEEAADALLMDAAGKSTPCISVQEEFKEETITPTEVLLEDADKKTVAPSAIADKEPTDSNLVISDNHVEEKASLLENPSPCEEHAATEVLENTVESVVEAITEKLTENIVQKPANVPPVDATGDPCVSVQEELIEKNVPLVDVLLEGADKQTATPSVVAVKEPTDPTLENIVEEPAAEQADVPPMDATGESQPCVSVQVSVAPSDDADKETAAPPVVVVKDQPTDSNPVISKEPVWHSASRLENPSPCEERSTNKVLENIVESVVEAITEKPALTETIVEEPADEQAKVSPMDATGESQPCVSVQVSVAPSEDADKETAAPPVVVVKDQPTDSNPVISKEPVGDGASHLQDPSPCEEHPTTKVLEDILESAFETITEKPALTETIVEECADEQAKVSPMDATGESQPCVSVQVSVAPSEDADKETAAPPVVVVKDQPTDSNPVISKEPVGDGASHLQDPSPCEEHPTTKVLEDILESAFETITEKPALTETIVEECADEQAEVSPMDTAGESQPCVSVKVSVVPSEDADKDKAAPPVVVVKDQPTDSNPVISKEPMGDSASRLQNPSPCEEHPTTKVLEDILESAFETITEKPALTETIVEECADEQAEVSPMDTAGESQPCVSVQVSVAPSDDADKETAAPPVVVVKDQPTDSNPVISKEPVWHSASRLENPSPCEERSTNKVLENIVESVVEAITEKPALTETIVEEPADEQAKVSPMDATGESQPCVSVQVSVAPSEDADKETAAPPVVVVKDQPTDSNPVISKEPVGDGASHLQDPSPCEEHPTTKVLEDILESAFETITEKPALTETIVEECADEQAKVSPMDATGESQPCVSVQVSVAPSEDADKETAAPPVVVVKDQPTDSNPVISKEPVGDGASHLQDPSPCEEHPTTKVLEDILESAFETITEKPALTETIVEECADEQAEVSPMDTAGESQPCVSVKVSVVPSEDADKDKAAPPVVVVKDQPTDSNPVISKEPMGDSASRLQNPSPCEEHPTTKVLEDIVESVVGTITEKPALAETIVEEPADEQAEVSPMDATGEPAPCVSVQEELVEEKVVPAEVLLEAADIETVAPSVIAVEEPTDCNPVTSEEPVEECASVTEPKVTKDIVNERGNSGDILADIDGTFKDFLIATSGDKAETTLEEIITEDVAAECTLVASEEAAPEIIAAGETEEKAENESSANSTESTQSAEMINKDTVTCAAIDALLVRLQSASSSVVEESAYKLGDLQTSSLGDTVTVTIQVAPKEVQQ